jgi:enoyl-CoA hydratase/carnithine racemase
MRMQKNSGRNGGAEVLGTMSAIHAPMVQDFQFVKFRTESEVARLTLDRPEHNLLNERMLAEVAAGINSLSERSEVKLIVMDSAGKAFSGGACFNCWTRFTTLFRRCWTRRSRCWW